MRCLYLKKATGPQPISFCDCLPDEALIASPGQLNCPWCGCGWLFSCTHCRKAFTVATAIESPFSLRELVTADVERYYKSTQAEDVVLPRLNRMAFMLKHVVPGRNYVYLDGAVHEVGVEINFAGEYGSHSFRQAPHGEPGATYESLRGPLGRDYWLRAAGKPPNTCYSCGELWPEMFMVPNEDWKKYIPASKRDKMICWGCFQQIVNHVGGRLPKPRWIHKVAQ